MGMGGILFAHNRIAEFFCENYVFRLFLIQ